MPPDNVAIIETSAPPAQIEQALASFGYTATPVSGGTLYSIRGDHEIDLRSPTRAGQLGHLNRIALLGNTLAVGRATAPVNGVVTTAGGTGASLADDPIYHALAMALTAPAVASFGELVGVILLGQPLADDPLLMLAETNEAGQAQLDAYAQATLPPYLALGFATQRAGETSALTLAVVFPPNVDGAAAAAMLGARVANYTSVVTQRSLTERWSLAQAVAVTDDGLPVALVTMRIRQPKDAAAYVRPLAWNDLIAARDLLFLTVGEPVRP